MLRSPVIRSVGAASTRRTYAAALTPLSQRCQAVQQGAQQTRQAHAISNPTLANIEKRWEAMPPQEQADLWMALRDRMKVDWNELTLQEKKAGRSFSILFCAVLCCFKGVTAGEGYAGEPPGGHAIEVCTCTAYRPRSLRLSMWIHR